MLAWKWCWGERAGGRARGQLMGLVRAGEGTGTGRGAGWREKGRPGHTVMARRNTTAGSPAAPGDTTSRAEDMRASCTSTMQSARRREARICRRPANSAG